MNKVYIIGRITHDLELKHYNKEDDPKPYLKFSVAVNKKDSKGEKQTDFIDIVAFNRRAEIISQYFKKGSKISIQGHISTRSYIDNSNQKRYGTNVILENFEFIETKQSV